MAEEAESVAQEQGVDESSYRQYRSTRLADVIPPEDSTASSAREDLPIATDAPVEEEEKSVEPSRDEKRRDRNENRFQRLNARARSLERENAELKGRLDALTEFMQKPEKAASRPSTSSDGRPSRDQYDTEEGYYAALDRYIDRRIDEKTQSAWTAEQERAQKQQREADLRARQATYAEQVAVARTRHEDYDEVVDGTDVHVSDVVTAGILDSSHGPELVYYLAQHPQEAQRLNALSPVGVGRALAQIEAQVVPARDETAASSPPLPTAQTPPPLTPVSGQGTTPVERAAEDLSYREYRAARLKRRR